GAGETANPADSNWLSVAPRAIEGVAMAINQYFHDHPEMVLGVWSRQDTLYGEGFSITSNGDLARQLHDAMRLLPESAPLPACPIGERPRLPFAPSPAVPPLGEGIFYLGANRTICQCLGGQAVPVTCGGTPLPSFGPMTGKRLAALIAPRDRARRVLQS